VSGRFWPAREAAQAEYERLRRATLAGESFPSELALARFRRRGLAGLIGWTETEPAWLSELVGAERPAWCGRDDPRERALCEVYGFLLERASSTAAVRAVSR
jgi:hypothetical protein